MYRELARRCDYALHLGLTEAGMGTKERSLRRPLCPIAAATEGIGDTIRVSLTPSPVRAYPEVVVASEILQAWGMRVLCPASPLSWMWPYHQHQFSGPCQQIDDFLRAQMPVWRALSGRGNLRVAVMGCIVNGPGESKHADIGISLPGTGRRQPPRSLSTGKRQ